MRQCLVTSTFAILHFYLAPKSPSPPPAAIQPIKSSKSLGQSKAQNQQLNTEDQTNKKKKKKKKPMADPKSPLMLSSFLYKSILFAIIIALLPLFPPQTHSPKNPTFLSRTWELLHLLLVGIAISYGLFSRRNADPDPDKDKEKDATFKPDSTSHVSTILQISSVFDDEDPKSESWSSQYHPPDPMDIQIKPLLLPLRSLKKSRVQNSDSVEDDDAFSSSPPPPPPPPSFTHVSLIPTRRGVKKSLKDELKDLSMNSRRNKKKVEFMEKMIVMSDDSESEKGSDSSDVRVEAKENEVDKKADEFIAKFREQIRLQRIESIKKSSGHRAVKNAK